MGLPAARIGDIGTGTCCCHPPIPCIGMTGILIEGAATVNTNSISQSRLTDTVLGNCGHVGQMITCSGTVYAESLGTVRLSDQFQGCFFGQIVSGSPDVYIGG